MHFFVHCFTSSVKFSATDATKQCIYIIPSFSLFWATYVIFQFHSLRCIVDDCLVVCQFRQNHCIKFSTSQYYILSYSVIPLCGHLPLHCKGAWGVLAVNNAEARLHIGDNNHIKYLDLKNWGFPALEVNAGPKCRILLDHEVPLPPSPPPAEA